MTTVPDEMKYDKQMTLTNIIRKFAYTRLLIWCPDACDKQNAEFGQLTMFHLYAFQLFERIESISPSDTR